MSYGPKESGGFYTFNGAWNELSHEGIQWLTDYADISSNVSRLKTAQIEDHKVLLLWEVWTGNEYRYTSYMIADAYGGVVQERRNMCYPLRLDKADDMVKTPDGKITTYSGLDDKKISVYKISI